jgi:alpha-D-xyloside xylohydrolase
VKQGSILPLGPKIQYADENPFGELEIRVYQGADGEFVLYEDEGDNLNYQSGKYSLIKFTYTEASKKLKILKREGSFDGMKQERVFKVTTGEKVVQTVNYKGDEVEISL